VKLGRAGAEIFVQDGRDADSALARTTHMGIVAHPDDLEILASRGILDCFGRSDRWFCGVVACDGAGSARSGPYAAFTDEQMREVRRQEQRKAAVVGEYGAVVLLDYTSAQAKAPGRKALVADLRALLDRCQPEVVYTHNLADRHDTHVATALGVIEACRALPLERRPRRLLGGEVWRDLDWLADPDKVAEDVAERESLAMSLIGLFDSQIAGGKRYDLAVLGRRRAHATYRESHQLDRSTALSLAMDLTPLLQDDRLEPMSLVRGLVERFSAEVRERLARLGSRE
jgi:LmbE family N-acetylglucosaminyl deacetylase